MKYLVIEVGMLGRIPNQFDVVDCLDSNDPYDNIFVAAQNSRLSTILSMLYDHNDYIHIVLP